MRPRPRSAPRCPWSALEPLEPRSLLAAVFWDGGGDGLRWEDAANWSGNALPGVADDVTIDAPGLITITHSTPGAAQVRSLNCLERLVIQDGRIGVERWWTQHGPMDLRGGMIAGPGDLAIAGPALWVGGSMAGAGRTIVSGGGTLQVEGDVTLARGLTNRGLIGCWRGTLTLQGATLGNEAGAGIEWTSPGMITGSGALLRNAGRIEFSGPAARIDVPLEFSGPEATILAQDLWLSGGVVRAGDIRVSGVLRLSGQTRFTAGTSLTGSGTIVVTGGSHTVAAEVALPLVIESGAIRFVTAQSLPSVTLRGGWLIADATVSVGPAGMSWYGGTVAGPGALRLAPSWNPLLPQGSACSLQGTIEAPGRLVLRGNLTIRGRLDAGDLVAAPLSSVRLVDGTLTGHGRFAANVLILAGEATVERDVFVFGYFGVEAGAQVRLEGATITVAGATAAFGIGGSQPVWIEGAGALRVGATSRIFTHTEIGAGILLDNTGVVEARASLVVHGPVEQLAAGTLGGGWSVLGTAGAASIEFAGAQVRRSAGVVVLSGAGAAFPSIGTLDENAGTLTVTGGASVTLAPAGGALANSGVIDLLGARLQVTGAFTQDAEGELRLRTGGPLTPGLIVSGIASLGGLFRISGPAPAAPFTLLTAAAVAGRFGSVDLAGLTQIPSGRIPALSYEPGAVRLLLVEA